MREVALVGWLVGVLVCGVGMASAQQAKDVELRRPCVFGVELPAGRAELRSRCPNHYGGSWEIKAVACVANAAGVTVNPRITDGPATSVLAMPLTCGDTTRAGVKAKANVRLAPLGADGAQCGAAACDLQVTVTAPPGGGPYEVTISIIGEVTVGPKP